MYHSQAHYARVFGAWTRPTPAVARMRDTKWKPTVVHKQSLAVATFFAFQAIAWATLTNVWEGLESPISVSPKNQRDARSRKDWERWVGAEQIEMRTCYDKGTFEIVDLPPGVKELPPMFQYALKTGPNGEFIKCKARVVARGDLQFESEYGDTFAPTSRFSVIRLLIAIATQAGLMLFQFDIRGAFLCADIDGEIYLKLPPGYEPPPGKQLSSGRVFMG